MVKRINESGGASAIEQTPASLPAADNPFSGATVIPAKAVRRSTRSGRGGEPPAIASALTDAIVMKTSTRGELIPLRCDMQEDQSRTVQQ